VDVVVSDPDFTLDVQPNSQSAAKNTQVDYDIVVAPIGTFGTVNLTAIGTSTGSPDPLPTATYTFPDGTSVPNANGTKRIRIDTSKPSIVSGKTYSFTVTGMGGSPVKTHSEDAVLLTITSASQCLDGTPVRNRVDDRACGPSLSTP
jgi:hypothetical protein